MVINMHVSIMLWCNDIWCLLSTFSNFKYEWWTRSHYSHMVLVIDVENTNGNAVTQLPFQDNYGVRPAIKI